jgi:hypothetical protein
MSFQNTKTSFVQKPTTKPILDHSTLKEEQFVIYLDKMPSVLQTCPYIFYTSQNQSFSNSHVLQI